MGHSTGTSCRTPLAKILDPPLCTHCTAAASHALSPFISTAYYICCWSKLRQSPHSRSAVVRLFVGIEGYWQLLMRQLGTRTFSKTYTHAHAHTHTHTFNSPFPGLPGWADTRKVKPIWILLKQETVSGSGISWAICKSAPHSRQITTRAPHHSCYFTGRMPFLPANQQRQSTEGDKTYRIKKRRLAHN